MSTRGPRFDDSTETMVRAAPAARPLGAVVEVVGPNPSRRRFERGQLTIGSAPDCDLVVSASTVSRRHVSLELVPEGVLVQDLGSHNGTYYLGQRIERMVLSFGGQIQIGGATVVVHLDGASFELEAYRGTSYRGIIGPSTAMRRLFAKLERLEGSLVTVLIEGESGVGKELVARALHQGSSVADGPLVVLNCGAVARELVASELFGHLRGAFTGAIDTRRGAFELADRGTLFLDEIAELPLEVQPMLLRALELGEVRPVGGNAARRVKVRVIAATNRDLEAEVQAGRFRGDLFYRLAVVRLLIPPLRERFEDIDALSRHFAHAAGLVDLPPAIVAELRRGSWPGNVRELRNVIQAYAALGALPEAPPALNAALDDALQGAVDVTRPYTEQKDAIVDRFTRFYLQQLLARAGGNQTLAASLAGLTRGYLGRLVHKHGLGRRPPDDGSDESG